MTQLRTSSGSGIELTSCISGRQRRALGSVGPDCEVVAAIRTALAAAADEAVACVFAAVDAALVPERDVAPDQGEDIIHWILL
jgi:hypothetical protein